MPGNHPWMPIITTFLTGIDSTPVSSLRIFQALGSSFPKLFMIVSISRIFPSLFLGVVSDVPVARVKRTLLTKLMVFFIAALGL